MDYFNYVLAALLIIEGLVFMVTGKSLGENTEQIAQKYDMESYRKFNRFAGLLTALAGVLFLIMGLSKNKIIPVTIPFWVELVVIAIIVVLMIIGALVMLKKKDGGRGNGKKTANKTEEYIDED